MLEPHANLTGPSSLNDSFTFLLRADHVQPATGCLPFTIVPPGPFLSQTFTPNVSFLVTDNLVTISLSQEKPVVSSEPTTQTGTLGKLTQTRWPEAAPWGRHGGEEPTLDVTASPTRVIWSSPPRKRRDGHPSSVWCHTRAGSWTGPAGSLSREAQPTHGVRFQKFIAVFGHSAAGHQEEVELLRQLQPSLQEGGSPSLPLLPFTKGFKSF